MSDTPYRAPDAAVVPRAEYDRACADNAELRQTVRDQRAMLDRRCVETQRANAEVDAVESGCGVVFCLFVLLLGCLLVWAFSPSGDARHDNAPLPTAHVHTHARPR